LSYIIKSWVDNLWEHIMPNKEFDIRTFWLDIFGNTSNMSRNIKQKKNARFFFFHDSFIEDLQFNSKDLTFLFAVI